MRSEKPDDEIVWVRKKGFPPASYREAEVPGVGTLVARRDVPAGKTFSGYINNMRVVSEDSLEAVLEKVTNMAKRRREVYNAVRA